MTHAHTVGTAVLPARGVLGQEKGKPRSRRAMSLTPESARLMKSARGQLSEAENAAQDADKFEFSHRAALRIAGALIDAESKGARSRKVESIWQRLARLFPEFNEWAIVFEEGALVRVRVLAGDEAPIREGRAAMWLNQTRRFYDEAAQLLGVSPEDSWVDRSLAA